MAFVNPKFGGGVGRGGGGEGGPTGPNGEPTEIIRSDKCTTHPYGFKPHIIVQMAFG